MVVKWLSWRWLLISIKGHGFARGANAKSMGCPKWRLAYRQALTPLFSSSKANRIAACSHHHAMRLTALPILLLCQGFGGGAQCEFLHFASRGFGDFAKHNVAWYFIACQILFEVLEHLLVL